MVGPNLSAIILHFTSFSEESSSDSHQSKFVGEGVPKNFSIKSHNGSGA